MAKLGQSGVRSRRIAKAPLTAGAQNQLERRYDNTVPVGTELATESTIAAREAAYGQKLRLEAAGLEGSPEWKRAAQISEKGALDPEGRGSFLANALSVLDAPGRLARSVVADFTGADTRTGKELNFQAHMDALFNKTEKLATGYGELYGEDGYLVGREMLEAYGWNRKEDWGWGKKAAQGFAGFAVDVALDPLSYVTLGGGGATKRGLLKMANSKIDNAMRLINWDQGAGRFVASNGDTLVKRAAEKANQRLAAQRAKTIEEFGEEAFELLLTDDLAAKKMFSTVRSEAAGDLLDDGVGHALAAKRYDLMPDWWQSSDMITNPLKGGLRYLGRNIAPNQTRGLMGKAKGKVGETLRKSEKLDAALDKVLEKRSGVAKLFNKHQEIIDLFKAKVPGTGMIANVVLGAQDTARAVGLRQMREHSLGVSNKLIQSLQDAGETEIGRVFRDVVNLAQDGRVVTLNAERLATYDPKVQAAVIEFVDQWDVVRTRLHAEAAEVGLDMGVIENYIPAMISREMRDFIDTTLDDVGMATWWDEAADDPEIAEGLAWLNEIVSGRRAQVGQLADGESVVGATRYANERTLGRGATVRSLDSEGQLWFMEFPDGVANAAYASQMDMDEKIVRALKRAIDRHNAQPNVKKIKTPKWLDERLASPDVAQVSAMEINPFNMLDSYQESVGRAIIEMDLAQKLKSVGLVSGQEFRLDAGRIAHRLSKTGHPKDVRKSERQVRRMLERLDQEIEDLENADIAFSGGAQGTNTVVERIGDLEVRMSREVAASPRVQRAVAKAKTEAATQKKTYKAAENRRKRLVAQLRAKGVSQEAAEQVANAETGPAARALYHEIVEEQRRQMIANEAVVREALKDILAEGDAEVARVGKAHRTAYNETTKAIHTRQWASETMQTEYAARATGPKRVRFDTLADKALLRERMKQRLLNVLNAWYDEAQPHGEFLVSNHPSLQLAIQHIMKDEWPEAAIALNRFMSATWGEDSAIVRKLVEETTGQYQNMLQNLFRRNGGVRSMEGSTQKMLQWHRKVQGMLDAADEVEVWNALYSDALERSKMRKVWKQMDEILDQQDRAILDIEATYRPLWKLQQEFEDTANWMYQMEQGGLSKFSDAATTRRFTNALREAGIMQKGDWIDWRGATPGGPGFTIRSAMDNELPSWEQLNRAAKDAGFESIEDARAAADIAAFPSEEAWVEFQASAWGSLEKGSSRHIARGYEWDSPEKLATRWSTNWENVIKTHWPSVPDLTVQDFGNGMTWERRLDAKGGVAEEAIVWRNEAGDIIGLLSAERRDPGRVKAIGERSSSVYIGLDPMAPNMIDGVKPIAMMRRLAEEARFPMFAGSGQSGYTLEGARSAYRAAKKMTEGMSEDVRLALREVDPWKASKAADAEHTIATRGAELIEIEPRKEWATELVGRFRGIRGRMAEVQTGINQNRLSGAEARKRARQIGMEVANDEELTAGLGTEAVEKLADWVDNVERVTFLRESKDATVNAVVDAAATTRQVAFDPDRARMNLNRLASDHEALKIEKLYDDYEKSLDDLQVLRELLIQILDLPDGNLTRYLPSERAAEATKLIRRAEAKWADLIGEPVDLKAARTGSSVPVQTKPGWVPAKAAGLLGPAFEDAAGDAAALRFVHNILDTQMAMATPAGMNMMRKYYSGIFTDMLAWWKTMATVVRVPFHVRNFIGAAYNNAIAGVKLRNYREASGLFVGPNGVFHDSFFSRLMIQGQGIEQALEALPNNPRLRAAVREAYEEGMFLETIAENEIKRRGLRSLKPKGKLRKGVGAIMSTQGTPAYLGGKAMQAVESYHRMAAFLRHWDDVGDGRYALEWVNTVHFDYSDLTSTERAIKRYLPFFVWAKNNVPLQLRALVESPGVAARYQHFFLNMDDALNDSELPGNRWRGGLHAGLGVGFGEEEGFYAQMLFDPQLPIEDLEDMRMNPLSVASLIANQLGPQFMGIQKTPGSYDYMVDSPGGFHHIVQWLGKTGMADDLFQDTNTGLSRVNPAVGGYMRSLVPWMSDYVGPFAEQSPTRLERMGAVGGRDAQGLLGVLGMGARDIATTGLGITWEGPGEAYSASTDASFALQDDIYNLRKGGWLTLEDDERWEKIKGTVDMALDG